MLYVYNILDEVHERAYETEILLLLAANLCKSKYPLKVIVMSATIDTDTFYRCLIVQFRLILMKFNRYFSEPFDADDRRKRGPKEIQVQGKVRTKIIILILFFFQNLKLVSQILSLLL